MIQKMNLVKDLGADGVLLGVPYYETLHVQDAIKFYHDIADLFPSLNIVIYHNPGNHKFTIPVAAFRELVKKSNIIGMKDSHRTTQAFMNLQKIVRGKISVFVNQTQLYPYYAMGAAGCWSTEVWMGPWPILYLLDQARKGDIPKMIVKLRKQMDKCAKNLEYEMAAQIRDEIKKLREVELSLGGDL